MKNEALLNGVQCLVGQYINNCYEEQQLLSMAFVPGVDSDRARFDL